MSELSNNEAVLVDHGDASDYNPEYILPESPEEIAKIRKWLRPTNYNNASGEYRKHEQCYVPGTGSWLTATNTYNDWLNGTERGLLWIKGIPGSGKSVIAAKLVNELSKSHPGVPVLFFFRQIIDANHEPTALLRDWLDQVLIYSPPLQQRLKKRRESRRSLESMSMDDLWKDLQFAFIGLPGKVFCIADALDEMDQGNDAFVQALGTFGQWQPAKVKVLITSRPVPSVGDPLRWVQPLQIRLQERLVDVDISFFVQQSLRGTSIQPSDQDLIQGAVPGRANGLFLYAKLALDAFLEPGARIKEVLKSLPTDLSHMYTNLLHEHARRSGVPNEIQLLILQWITHATRPLRLLEIAEMINTTYYSSDSCDLKNTKDLVRAAMGPLVEILPDETICVVHHSFTEYLKGSSRIGNEHDYQVLQPGHTHTTLALACLAYLRAGCLYQIHCDDVADVSLDDETEDDDIRAPPISNKEKLHLKLKYPFLEYAAANWYIHAVKAAVTDQEHSLLLHAIGEFLSNHHTKTAWVKFEWGSQRRGAYERVTSLHIAAKFGLVGFTKALLNAGKPDVDACDAYGKTPLWWAADQGHADVVRMLIAAGGNPDQEEKISGLKPLHRAADKNHHETVKALLEAGVDPLTKKTKENPGRWCGNAPRTRGHTALMYACQNSHLETVDVFLSFIKDIDTVQRALAWAAGRSHKKILARILEYPGLDVNTKVRGDTALYTAASSVSNRDKILALIEAGADPKILCEGSVDEFASSLYQNRGHKQDSTRGTTALHALCGGGTGRDRRRESIDPAIWRDLFFVLITAGADVHQKDHRGATALHRCAHNPVMIRLLLEAGAGANASADDGTTPLHNAKLAEAIEVLLKEGNANINQASSDGQTPLLRRMASRDVEAILKLLEHNVDVHVEDDAGNGVLHIAVKLGGFDSTILKKLMSAGADPNHKNRAGNTPMHLLRLGDSGAFGILDTFIAAGANINERDGSGATTIFRSCTWDNNDVKELMIRGAATNLRDYTGRSLLHDAIKRYPAMAGGMAFMLVETPRFDFLLNLGLDISQVDYRGNTLFHELALRCLRDSYVGLALWHQLKSLAINIDQRNHQGRTTLHILSTKRQASSFVEPEVVRPIDFVLSCTQDINAIDRNGIAPLHLAVTTSEVHTKKLLDAGADPNIATFDGLTPLHLAARSQESNNVGLLLGALSSQTKAKTINARDSAGWTPLCHACRSGRPETVALLLDAGCDLSNHKEIYAALSQFEDEQSLWKRSQQLADKAENGDAGGLTLREQSRPASYEDHWVNVPQLLPKFETARLEEIVDMLITKGWGLDDASLDIALDHRQDYTALCLLKARNPHNTKQSMSKTGTGAASFAEHALPYRRKATMQAIEEFGQIKQGKSNHQLIVSLLRRREYEVIEKLSDLGVDFFDQDENEKCSSFDFLIRNGYSALVNKICLSEAEARSRKGNLNIKDSALEGELCTLTQADAEVKPQHIRTSGAYSALVYALHRSLPNMEVVRALVEKLHVDVNELVSDTTALHQVARGQVWWSTHLALPYLISKGAHLDIRDSWGRSPLHTALGGPGRRDGMHYKEAVRMLVDAGADVNAVDASDKSCLSYAGKDVQIIRLLIEHGAIVEVGAVFAAIDERHVEVLEALLTAGAFANTKFSMSSRNMPVADWFPVQYAATKHSTWTSKADLQRERDNNACVQMVKTLLNHGADPFATYTEPLEGTKADTNLSDEDGETDTASKPKSTSVTSQIEYTILHELMIDGDIVHPFFDIPDLDPNHRDSQGRTLLHAATHSRFGPDAPVDQVLLGRHGKSEQVSLLNRLLAMGADVLARDNDGRNALHYMFEKHDTRYFPKPKVMGTLRMLASEHPSLLEMRDKKGRTPLHAAVIYAVAQGVIEPTQALLDAGADPNISDNDGNKAIHILAYRLHEMPDVRHVFTQLLARTPDVNCMNKSGESPLFGLYRDVPKRFQGYYSVNDSDIDEDIGLLTLKNAGADLFARNNIGQGLLHYAARGKVSRFQALLDKGLDPMMEDNNRRTALDIAAACGNDEILALFERNGKEGH